MVAFVGIMFIILQIGFIIYTIVHLITDLISNKRKEIRFNRRHMGIQIFLLILFICCFLFYKLSSFNGEVHFIEFGIITLIASMLYGLQKLGIFKSYPLQIIGTTFMGTFFWLAFFTAIKFLPYMPLAWFPMYGLLATAPLLLSILSLSEIRYQCMQHDKLSLVKSLLYGLVPLVILQFVMNFYTIDSWAFIHLFDPSNTRFL